MKVVLQRVTEASVTVNNIKVGEIEKGLLLLVGADSGDDEKVADNVADRCLGLRIFEDENGKMNLNVKDAGGAILAISQFTLSADISKGRRPSFSSAMNPEGAEKLYDYFVEKLKESKLNIQTGQFGAKMQVRLLNDGPVTFVLEG